MMTPRGKRRVQESIKRTDRELIENPVRQYVPAEVVRGLLMQDLLAPTVWGKTTSALFQVWFLGEDNVLHKSGDTVTIYNDDPSLTIPYGTNLKLMYGNLGWEIVWQGGATYPRFMDISYSSF